MNSIVDTLKDLLLVKSSSDEQKNEAPIVDNSSESTNVADELESTEVRKPVTKSAVKRMYGRPSSFVDKLPWVEFQTDSNTVLLDDGKSVGAVFDVIPIATEGRSYSWLQNRRDLIQDALQDSFDELAEGEWIVQQYAFDDDNLETYIDKLYEYPKDYCKDSVFTKEWLKTMSAHLRGICKEGGLFDDKEVLDAPWGGKIRRIKMVIYRRLPAKYSGYAGMTPEEEINDSVEKIKSALRDAGIELVRNDRNLFFDWLLDWFNPRPEITGGDRNLFREMASFNNIPEDEIPFGEDLAESLFFSMPKSDKESQTWWFDGLPHRCIRVNKIRRTPKIGQISGEVGSSTPDGESTGKASCMMDKFPAGTIVATTIVITPQDRVQGHLQNIESKSKGESVEASLAKKDVDIAKAIMGNKQNLYQTMMCVYIRGEDLKDLRKKSNAVSTLLLTNGLAPLKDEHETIGLDAYILNLPMVFEPKMDDSFRATRPVWTQHIANISSLFGRHRGTGNVGQTNYNRGGEPISFDPFHPGDRKKNGHGLILGPSGAGKSATITNMSAQIMAMHRPRLFIIEAGDSFGLLGDYFKDKDVSVNKVQLKPGSGVSLPPFADAYKLLAQDETEILGSNVVKDIDLITEADLQRHIPNEIKINGVVKSYASLTESELREVRNKAAMDVIAELMMENESADEGDEQRDIMGEMEIIATLMITGGEEEEAKKLTRADRRMIRDAILNGAKLAHSENRITMTADVAEGFVQITHNEKYPEDRQKRAFDMGESLRMFCDGFEGEVFNSEGIAWPDTDVTIVDLATFAREGYGAQLAIAYTSIMMRINNLAEQHQHDQRPIVMLTDEGHIITTNPLLAPFVVKVVKMWRKLGAWWWVATQNMADFPASAKKMLNMIEWWICLVMPQDEIEDIAAFKSLSNEQKALMLSATKEPKKYTEGVVLSDNLEALFRSVPPSLYLSLAGTEKDEKTERANIMRKFGVSEVEAAEYVGKKIDWYRQIAGEPEDPKPKKVSSENNLAQQLLDRLNSNEVLEDSTSE